LPLRRGKGNFGRVIQVAEQLGLWDVVGRDGRVQEWGTAR